MASQTKSPTQSSTSAGAPAWTDTDNVFASDNLRARCEFSTIGSVSNTLLVNDFGFTVPSGSTINGIEVSIERASSPKGAFDDAVYLALPGEGDSNSLDESANWPLSDGINVYGGPTNTWGLTITPDMVNSSSFYVALIANASSPCVASIDHIFVIVYYTLPPSFTTFEVSASESFTINDSTQVTRGQGLAQESVAESFSISDTATVKHTIKRSLTESFTISDFAGNNQENTGLRCVSSTNDIGIRWKDIVNVVESSSRDFQVNKYGDGHNSIYLKSAWRKQWIVSMIPNQWTIELVEAMRADVGDIKLFPLYKYDKSTFHKTRVDNRAPMYFYANGADRERLLSLIFYEVV